MRLERRAGPYAFALLLAAVLGRPAAAPAAVDFQNFDYAQVPCSAGGVAGAYVYNVHPNAAVLLGSVGGASWGGDWGSGPSSIHVRFAKQFLYVDTCSNQDCTTREVRTYALRAGKLVKVYVLSHKVR